MSAKRPHQKRTKSGPEKRREDIKPHINPTHIAHAKNPVDNSGGEEPEPHATNSGADGYAPPGGSGSLGKFTMPDSWTPDPDFTKRAALWGVNLKTDVTPFELADFITYWKAEGKAFHHDQWQQKLARSVQLSRSKPARTQQRDVNVVPEPDSEIPPGFRG
ncbi:TPA: DnaT-like ssDNA-binding domain-containing protein [Salmonella enterica subsp. enterica]